MSLFSAFRHRSEAASARLLAVVVLSAILVAPTPSTPSAVAEPAAAPAVEFTGVPGGATVGAPYTFSGTLTEPADVAAVEVSTDGGSLWRAATWQAGGVSWSHTYTPNASGQAQLRVRALDAAQKSVSTASATPDVAARVCPCGLWSDSDTPSTLDLADASALELGVRWRAASAGYVRGVRFYKGPGNTGTHTGSLWTTAGERLATGTFTDETASGWQTLTFPAPVAVDGGRTYVVSYLSPTGHFSADTDYFATSARHLEPLTALQSGTGEGGNGVYRSGGGFPNSTSQHRNYWVDVVWAPEPGADTRAPGLASTYPVGGAGSVPLSPAVSVTYDEIVDPGSVEFTLHGPDGPVAGTASVNGTVARFVPSAALAAGTSYTATARVRDAAGNQAAAYNWVFTTGSPRPAGCPCTVWDDFASPVEPAAVDTAAVEVGTKVQFNGRGEVLGVRFYKGQGNTGTHTGSFWSSTGLLLATGTFTDETTTGWQTLTFLSPVSVQANTTYVVSYYAPHGRYAVNPGFFETQAAYGGIRALAHGVDGGNGVFRYGGGFPGTSHNKNNYWVDVVYRSGFNGDQTPPTLEARTPASDATGVPVGGSVSLTYDEPIDPASPQVWLTDPGGVKLTGRAVLSDDRKTVVWTPSAALVANTRYTVHATAADVNGNATATTATWSITTEALAPCPCSLFSAATVPTTTSAADGNAYELGVRFKATYNGRISGVKFYKGDGNTGTHTGSLWSATGTRMATGTFTGETAAGWQTLTFAAPVDVRAGTTYVASYTAPRGRFAVDYSYYQPRRVDSPPLSAPQNSWDNPNGVYLEGSGFPTKTHQGNNYWVDVVYTFSGDTVPPVNSSHTPLNDATEVDLDGPVTATFDEPIDLANTTFTVTDGGGARLEGTPARTGDGHTVIWTPKAKLSANTRHSVSVRAADETANHTLVPVTWRFTTTATQTCPCTLFSDALVPDLDWVPYVYVYNVGVRFSPTVDGVITGVRFYKTGWNTGTHTGSLWASDGTRLATGTFTGETERGWQTLTFATPVPVTAGTSYVGSYTPSAHPARTTGYFSGQGVDSPPLTAPDGTRNGLFGSGTAGMPDQVAAGVNFFVDVVFETASP
ncbi:hypothetical protein FHS29_000156 [Saccharothrix tamanrassetensis]|uniref:Ig-like domain-containing protein n=1 Tax=Saccharothrix tamanrassetensis TaxID=1051531 RepID=A0A841CCV2_9PSEU|nr:DUF4082 domain-containing protein [Saccharothrix tamanrassetensis]MBB5953586.1 hypothetical protein [Saccharothrix tamanrassetensis]